MQSYSIYFVEVVLLLFWSIRTTASLEIDGSPMIFLDQSNTELLHAIGDKLSVTYAPFELVCNSSDLEVWEKPTLATVCLIDAQNIVEIMLVETNELSELVVLRKLGFTGGNAGHVSITKGSGGSLQVIRSNVEIYDSFFQSGKAGDYGGNIDLNDNAVVFMERCLVTNGRNDEYGGNIAVRGASILTLHDVTIADGRTTKYEGGGIMVWGGQLIAKDTRFLDNHGNGFGGGLTFQGYGGEFGSMSNCTFSGNTINLGFGRDFCTRSDTAATILEIDSETSYSNSYNGRNNQIRYGCPAGQYGSTNVTFAPQGQKSSDLPRHPTDCALCPVAYYAEYGSVSQCTACPMNQTTLEPGSESKDSCFSATMAPTTTPSASPSATASSAPTVAVTSAPVECEDDSDCCNGTGQCNLPISSLRRRRLFMEMKPKGVCAVCA